MDTIFEPCKTCGPQRLFRLRPKRMARGQWDWVECPVCGSKSLLTQSPFAAIQDWNHQQKEGRHV